MAGKENIADGLVASSSFSRSSSLSPRKSSRRTRSKSIGPGGLEPVEQPALKETSGNRRKSAFIPAVKSILASNDEDEKKRREARRKSLAKRRVSFAPEATLHTWDVVEYLRDATTSSASSEASRRASAITQSSVHASPAPNTEGEEPPSTPPEQAEEVEPQLGSSPANQREAHQKKFRRRSSGIPPMNFNNPDDIFSSSPLSGDGSPATGDNESDSSSEEEQEDSTAKIDSPSDMNDSQSSARLEAALRQASVLASTQRLDLDEDGDVSMDVVEETVTAAFKPWAKKTSHALKPAFNLPSTEDQENMDPFSPATPSEAAAVLFAKSAESEEEDDDGDDMSMDITRAVGRIVTYPQLRSPDQDDATMDLTMPLGSIQQPATKGPADRAQSLKRRRPSMLDASQGSPAKRPASRRASLRQQPKSSDSSVADDQTMDLTVAIGGIKNQESIAEARRNSIDTVLGDETMDFTMAVGSIKDAMSSKDDSQGSDQEEDEDLSMEFTNVIGGIKHFKSVTTPEKPTSPERTIPPKVKTPTPKKSPKKSPGLSRRSELKPMQPPPSPEKDTRKTLPMSPERPPKVIAPATPEVAQAPQQQTIEEFEPSPFVRNATPNATTDVETLPMPSNSTPTKATYVAPKEVANDPTDAPILNRRRSSLSSVQFSPLRAPREEPTLRSAALLSNSIKLLSTPRKQTLASPIKRAITPKKAQTPESAPTPKNKTQTPKKATPRKSTSPKKRVAFGEQSSVEEAEHVDELAAEEPQEDVERISLQEFLDMTKIRFMDLSTTKRRHTAAPAMFHDKEVDEKEDSLDRFVVAAASTLPEFELYQHACHEMKKYISEGRRVVRDMEAEVFEENPLLFAEYLTAPPDQRVIMDNQFKNLKTSARLDARGEWYAWRSRLLQDLKAGLLGTMEGFQSDGVILTQQEALLDAVLPPLVEHHERLEDEHKQLQQRHDELNSCDREQLERAREQLIAADTEIEEKRHLIAQLQEELAQNGARIEACKERKIEYGEEIKAAERMREECRGWSASEVNDLKVKVATLEQEHGWSITSASSTTITMTHVNDLELYFQPSAFASEANTPNASISLTYIGDTATPHPRPLTTSKRFFLQLIRAHLHCIPQSQTQIPGLLALVKDSWATALAVADGVRWLEHNYVTDESILSDERMAVTSHLLLPTLQTKIKVIFDIGVALNTQGVDTEVGVAAQVVYGERYNEKTMSAFLGQFCGSEIRENKDMSIWANGVVDLADKLKAKGRKGERV